MKTRNDRGFTLIEILLVVVIIGTLAAMVVPRLSGRSEKAKITITKVDIESNIDNALKLYELDNGYFPTTSQGLSALLSVPTTPPIPSNWSGPYLEKPPIDPWNNPYQYKNPGDHGSGFDLFSYGPDKSNEATRINNWS